VLFANSFFAIICKIKCDVTKNKPIQIIDSTCLFANDEDAIINIKNPELSIILNLDHVARAFSVATD
jgi:hypothetical protein